MIFTIVLVVIIISLFTINTLISCKLFGTIVNYVAFNNLLMIPKIIGYAVLNVANVRENILFSLFLYFLFFNFGSIVAMYLFRKRDRPSLHFVDIKWIMPLFVLLAVMITFFFVMNISPVFSSNPDIERQLFASGHNIFLRIPRFFLPMVVFTIILTRKSKASNNVDLLILSLFTLLLGHKSLMLSLTIDIICFAKIFKLKNRFSIKVFFVLGGVSFLLMFALLIKGSEQNLLLGIFSRLGSDKGIFYIFSDYVPNYGLTYGTTILNEIGGFFSKLTLNAIPFSEDFMTTGQFLVTKQYGPSLFEYLNLGFAEFYLNFGYMGVILFSFFISFIASVFFIKAFNRRNPVITVFFYFMCLALFGIFYNGKIGTTFISSVLSYCIALICIMVWQFAYRFSLRSNDHPSRLMESGGNIVPPC